MIELAHFREDDFDQLIDWIKDERLMTNWAGSLFSFPLTTGSLDWYIKDTNDLVESDALVYKAIDSITRETVGHISLGSISRRNRSGRISRVLVGSNAERGKGIGLQMVNQVLSIGFNELNLHRVSLGVFDFNKAAIRCYEKAGFVTEGVMRDVLWFEGAFWSIVEMSILKEEWLQPQTGKQATTPMQMTAAPVV